MNAPTWLVRAWDRIAPPRRTLRDEMGDVVDRVAAELVELRARVARLEAAAGGAQGRSVKRPPPIPPPNGG